MWGVGLFRVLLYRDSDRLGDHWSWGRAGSISLSGAHFPCDFMVSLVLVAPGEGGALKLTSLIYMN